MTFERIESGDADFVITLASPETTADWCAKSGLDTTEDNVSCDSAATERVLINAYRWAQGAETYGDKMFAYRQMLINHEIGHRLGHNHVTCDKDGDLAPVMQQQTKFLEYDGISCRPTPGPTPRADASALRLRGARRGGPGPARACCAPVSARRTRFARESYARSPLLMA